MSTINLVEGTSLFLREWAETIGSGQEELLPLIEWAVLRPEGDGRYVLTFVGIVIFRDKVVLSQPKFTATNTFGLAEILRILRGYFSRSHLRTPIEDSYRDPEFDDEVAVREFDALEGLLKWFSGHGVYRKEETSASASGRPHWVRTIAKCAPLIMQGSVVYPNIIAERREGVLNEISALQVSVTRALLERYGLPVPPAVKNLELALGRLIDKWPPGPDLTAYFMRCVDNQQRSTFRSDSLRLFSLLQGALESRGAGVTGRPQIFGTTAFYAVWEDACKTTIGRDLAIDQVARLAQPTWFTRGHMDVKTRRVQSHVPDLLVRRVPWLIILDAKYYFPFPSSRPGGPDIIKQLYYAEALEHLGEQTLSIFVFPAPGAIRPTFMGYATIEGSLKSFPPVEAWGVDPVWLLAEYPSISTSRADWVVDEILAGRPSVGKFIAQPPSLIGS